MSMLSTPTEIHVCAINIPILRHSRDIDALTMENERIKHFNEKIVIKFIVIGEKSNNYPARPL